jgi:hypothetical protein
MVTYLLDYFIACKGTGDNKQTMHYSAVHATSLAAIMFIYQPDRTGTYKGSITTLNGGK